MKKHYFTLVLLIVVSSFTFAQSAFVKGIVKDEFGKPIEGVTVHYQTYGATTNKNGAYSLEIKNAKNKRITLIFKHVSYNDYSKRINIQKNKTATFSPKLIIGTENIEVVTIDTKKKIEEERRTKSIEKIDKDQIKNTPSITNDASGVIKNKGLGVNQAAGEESSTYNVRGGNYDENLVYVNGIEVYRPFLVRSGQQEGLSFVNINMTKNVLFSSGGFESKYGDKLSSVLDITYRKPKKLAVQVDASLLGASVTIEDKLANDKLSAIVGARYRNTSLIVNAKDTEANFKPSFTDVQSYFSYEVNDKLSIDFLGNFALNKYNYEPVSRVTNFGTVDDPKALVVHYNGIEKDQYLTMFGALQANFKVNDDFTLSLTTSAYNTQEEEHFDIEAFYGIGEVNADFGSDNFGEVEFPQSIGSQLTHARNDLDALISNTQFKANYRTKKDAFIDAFEFGVKYQKEDIKDRINEFEIIDSAGFSVRPDYLIENDQPYNPYTGPIEAYNNVKANNHVEIDRITSYLQWNRETDLTNDAKLWWTLGARIHHWSVNDGINSAKSQSVISPRVQLAYKPDWEKDILFRFASGFYYQPPFYKELRDLDGVVHPEVKAQKSVHFVAGTDYYFKLWDRPFKLVSEAYYKNLTDVNAFTIDNVRIRYAANNNAKAYAAGFDARIGGEFVPGTESFFTFGYLQTKENLANQGYINRPTDQRLKFAVLFQDYLPTNENFKMYLNMVYNTGAPGGSPAGVDPYIYQSRLKDYFRSDIGFSFIVVDKNKTKSNGFLKHFKELSIGAELFNMFDVQNSITNTWVRDVSTKRSYAIPNYLSGRVLNAKVSMRF